jgi:DNA primase
MKDIALFMFSQANLSDVALLSQRDVDVRVAQLPDGEDPDTYAQRDPEGLARCVRGAKPALDYVLDEAIAHAEHDGVAGKAKVLAKVAPLLKSLRNQTVQELYVVRLASSLGIAADLVWRHLQSVQIPSVATVQNVPVRSPAEGRVQSPPRGADQSPAPGRPMSNRDAGPPNRDAGPPNRSAGPPNRSAGPPNRSAGSLNRSAGPPNWDAGSPNRSAGPPNLDAGPSRDAGPPNRSAGPPDRDAGHRDAGPPASRQRAGSDAVRPADTVVRNLLGLCGDHPRLLALLTEEVLQSIDNPVLSDLLRDARDLSRGGVDQAGTNTEAAALSVDKFIALAPQEVRSLVATAALSGKFIQTEDPEAELYRICRDLRAHAIQREVIDLQKALIRINKAGQEPSRQQLLARIQELTLLRSHLLSNRSLGSLASSHTGQLGPGAGGHSASTTEGDTPR